MKKSAYFLPFYAHSCLHHAAVATKTATIKTETKINHQPYANMANTNVMAMIPISAAIQIQATK